MKIIVAILGMIVLSLSVYSLITRNFDIQPYNQLLLGIVMLILGIMELKEKRKLTTILFFLTAGVFCYVGINSLFI